MFMVCEPLAGKRRVANGVITQRRTGVDVAEQFKQIVDQDYPDAQRITLVMDNLNTHHLGVLYDRYPPQEARRIAEKLEIHYTPLHGSWLNIAEIEFSVLHKQCLPPKRHIPDIPTLRDEVTAWTQARNAITSSVDWHFTPADARIKLKRLYPVPVVIS